MSVRIKDLVSGTPESTDCIAFDGTNGTKKVQINGLPYYIKPVGGVPATDLSTSVNASLAKAETAEQAVNKVTSVSVSSTNTQYPTAKAVNDQAVAPLGTLTGRVTAIENAKVTEVTPSSTDAQYPSAKAVYDDVYAPLNEDIVEESYARVQEDGRLHGRVSNLEESETVVDVEYPSEEYGRGVVPEGMRKYAKTHTIKGKTISWNQLMQVSSAISLTVNGVTWTNNRDGTYTANGTATGNSDYAYFHRIHTQGTPTGEALKNGHRYYIGIGYTDSTGISYRTQLIWYDENDQRIVQKDQFSNDIFTATDESKSLYVELRIFSGKTANNLVFKPIVVDLTLIYGAGNEPTTVGELLSDYPVLNEYCSYDSGSLKSASLTGMWSKDDDNTDLDSNSFPQPVTLRSASNVADVYDPEIGVITRNLGIAKLKDLNWNRYTDDVQNPFFYAVPPSANTNGPKLIVSKYALYGYNKPLVNFGNNALNLQYGSGASYGRIYIRDDAYSDAATFKSHFGDNDIVVYELASPSTESIQPVNPYLETESGGTIGLTHSEVPAVASLFSVSYTETDDINERVTAIETAKVTVVNASSTDLTYPSTKSVYDAVKPANENISLLKKSVKTIHKILEGQQMEWDEQLKTKYEYEVASDDGDVKGYAIIDELCGRSFAWNQLIQNGNFNGTTGWSSAHSTISVSDNVLTATCDADNEYCGIFSIQGSSSTWCVGHKYMISAQAKRSTQGSVFFSIERDTVTTDDRIIKSLTADTWDSIIGIITKTTNSSGVRITGKMNTNNTLMLKDVMVVDLTLLYGEDNEPETVADVIADYPELMSYCAYDAGTIKHCAVDKVVSTGMNLLDETNWARSGNDVLFNTRIKTLGNLVYASAGFDYSAIAYTYKGTTQQGVVNIASTFNLPSTTIDNFLVSLTNVSQYDDDFQVCRYHNSESINEYHPYFKDEYTVPSAVLALPNYGKSAGGEGDRNYIQLEPIIYKGTKSVDLSGCTWSGSAGSWHTTISDYAGDPLHNSIPSSKFSYSGTTLTVATIAQPEGVLHYHATSGGEDYTARIYVDYIGTVNAEDLTWTYNSTTGVHTATISGRSFGASNLLSNKYPVVSDATAMVGICGDTNSSSVYCNTGSIESPTGVIQYTKVCDIYDVTPITSEDNLIKVENFGTMQLHQVGNGEHEVMSRITYAVQLGGS